MLSFPSQHHRTQAEQQERGGFGGKIKRLKRRKVTPARLSTRKKQLQSYHSLSDNQGKLEQNIVF
jgi:hypothetical protein